MKWDGHLWEYGVVQIGKLFIVTLLVLAFGLSACGRRGALEAPPGDNNENKPIILDKLII